MKRSTTKAITNLALAKKLKDLADYDLDDALELVGLRRRRSAGARFLAGMGLVLGGMAVGTVLGMMLAPRAGRDHAEAGGRAQGDRPGAMHTGAGGYGARPVDAGSARP